MARWPFSFEAVGEGHVVDGAVEEVRICVIVRVGRGDFVGEEAGRVREEALDSIGSGVVHARRERELGAAGQIEILQHFEAGDRFR